MPTYRDIWIRNLYENELEVFVLEEDGERTLYETKRAYEYSNNFYYTAPTFHVWDGDSWLCCTSSYQEAINIFKGGENF